MRAHKDHLLSEFALRASVAFLIALTVLFPLNARAQQTLDGAYKFLSLLPSMGDIVLNLSQPNGDDITVDEWDCEAPLATSSQIATKHTHKVVFQPGTVTAIEKAPRHCHVMVSYKGWDLKRPLQGHVPEFEPGNTSRKTPFSAERIRDVTTTADGVEFLTTVFDKPVRLELRAPPNLRDRIAYALEFMRVECDPAAATGF